MCYLDDGTSKAVTKSNLATKKVKRIGVRVEHDEKHVISLFKHERGFSCIIKFILIKL
jgi:hypothetical protein